MAKKRINKEALFMVTSFVLCLGFTSFICMAFPALKISQSIAGITATTKVEGLIAVIGGKISTETASITILEAKFNFLSLIGYLLPLVAAVLAMLGLSKQKEMLFYIAGVLCLISAGLTLCEGIIFTSVNNVEFLKTSLLFGPIMSSICSIAAGAVSFGSWYIFHKK